MTVAPPTNTGPITLANRIIRAAPAPAIAALPAARRTSGLRMPTLAGVRGRPITTLGTGFLGIASTTIAVLLLGFEVGRFAADFAGFPAPGLVAGAWLLLAGLLVALAVTSRSAGDQLKPWPGGVITVGLAGVVALDAAGVWRTTGTDLGRDMTAAPAAGLVLLAMVGVRSARVIIATALTLAGALAVLVAASWQGTVVTSAGVESALVLILRASVPPIVGAWLVHTFRRVMSAELERVLVHATVSAPRFSVGMLASEELARLDLAAEQLLDDVATGRNRLPLNAASAQAAAELATELRLHLIEGRRQTWLYHAINESDLLGRTVVLSDPDSLAGLLDQRQRDGLLQAVWLLLGDSPQRSRRSALRVTVEVSLGQAKPVDSRERRMRVPIVLKTTGVARGRVDPATWDAVRKVGRHTDVQRGGSLRVEIDCVVDKPAE
jgi:hypothetical protein